VTKHLLILGLLLAATMNAARAQLPSPAAKAEPEAAAPAEPQSKAPSLRARVLELAGAMGNDGFKLRDGLWSGRLEPGQPKRLAVNLFAGNEYWFCAASPEGSRGPKLALFDPQGKPVSTLAYDGPGLAAVGVTAVVTGRYFVELAPGSGNPSEFCLIYLFK
jgi:hypothetical protein